MSLYSHIFVSKRTSWQKNKNKSAKVLTNNLFCIGVNIICGIIIYCESHDLIKSVSFAPRPFNYELFVMNIKAKNVRLSSEYIHFLNDYEILFVNFV